MSAHAVVENVAPEKDAATGVLTHGYLGKIAHGPNVSDADIDVLDAYSRTGDAFIDGPARNNAERPRLLIEYAKRGLSKGIAPREILDGLAYLNDKACWPRLSAASVKEALQLAIKQHQGVAQPGERVDVYESIAPASPKLHFEMFNTVKPDLAGVALVAKYLDRGAMSVLYGESNSGKTFFALDLALHIALGRQWMGRKVQVGAVVYVAAEGGTAIKKRLAAFREHHQLGVTAVPFALVPCPVDLLNPDADTQPLIDLIAAAVKKIGRPVVMVVIDTLARAIAGGNENASEDMGAFVRNVDRVRNASGAHTMVIHHSGKNKAAGARGHSSLRAATDTEIEIDQRTATATKQRDLEAGAPIGFDLQQVPIGKDADGAIVTSCVVMPRSLAVVPIDGPTGDALPAKGLAELRRLALAGRGAAVFETAWKDACVWIPRKNRSRDFSGMVRALVSCGHVAETIPGRYVPAA